MLRSAAAPYPRKEPNHEAATTRNLQPPDGGPAPALPPVASQTSQENARRLRLFWA